MDTMTTLPPAETFVDRAARRVRTQYAVDATRYVEVSTRHNKERKAFITSINHYATTRRDGYSVTHSEPMQGRITGQAVARYNVNALQAFHAEIVQDFERGGLVAEYVKLAQTHDLTA